jgi:hypothetical protein
MYHYELVNLKTRSTTLLPAVAIKNNDLKEAASNLSLYASVTKGIVKITRIG